MNLKNIKIKTSAALIFIILTYLVSWLEQARTIQNGHSQNSLDGFFLMWTPGLVGFLCSLFINRNINDLAIKKPTFKSLAMAYLVPAVTAVCVFALLILFNISEFEINPSAIEKLGSVQSVLLKGLIIAPTIGMIVPFVSGLGEEIGWRGFLHSQLLNYSPNLRYFITGIIWSIWHWPLILFGTYSTSDKPWLSVLLFTIMATSSSFLFGYLRDRSKSVFPAALMHASHNMWFLGITPGFLKSGPLASYFASESGLFCAVLYLLIAIFVALKGRNNSINGADHD
jgi:uncharacterized protein